MSMDYFSLGDRFLLFQAFCDFDWADDPDEKVSPLVLVCFPVLAWCPSVQRNNMLFLSLAPRLNIGL